ncbi:MAG TPA: hypothetical protein VGD59_02730 [Acidisarcina sp.]
MANLEAAQETRPSGDTAGSADVLIGVPAPTQGTLLHERVADIRDEFRSTHPSIRCVVAYPGIEGTGELSTLSEPAGELGSLRAVEYTLSHGAASTVPWLGLAPAYARLADLAIQMGAGACAILSPDLAAFDVHSITLLLEPLMDGRAELTMPLYAPSKFEGLLNSGILYPLSRALYGRRVRYPLGPDFGVTTSLLTRLGRRRARGTEVEDDQAAIWPATEAALSDSIVAQVHLDGRHGAQNEGLDLPTVLGLLVGSIFNDAERNPVVWQRVRGSQAGLTLGATVDRIDPGAKSAGALDVRSMLEAFNLGSRNLQQVWALVLPPVTLLEIKRLGRLTPEQFRIPDALWARIIYDFALAYRLRTLSRTHLLGALTPLYLGWVASYAQEIANLDAFAAEQRVEKLAKVYEDEKPYFVSRWRWPDRFNP